MAERERKAEPGWRDTTAQRLRAWQAITPEEFEDERAVNATRRHMKRHAAALKELWPALLWLTHQLVLAQIEVEDKQATIEAMAERIAELETSLRRRDEAIACVRKLIEKRGGL